MECEDEGKAIQCVQRLDKLEGQAGPATFTLKSGEKPAATLKQGSE